MSEDEIDIAREIYEKKTGKKIPRELVKSFIQITKKAEDRVREEYKGVEMARKELLFELSKTSVSQGNAINELTKQVRDLQAQVWRLQNK